MKLTKTQIENFEKNRYSPNSFMDKWAIVTETGEVIEKYRCKFTAITNVRRLSIIHIGCKLKVVKLWIVNGDLIFGVMF